MTVRHLPPEDLLLDYAAGNLPEPLALLVAAHLTLAPESRRIVAELESVGGAMLEDIEPAEIAPDALESVLARLDAEEPEAPAAAPPLGSPSTARMTDSGIILPAPLRERIGGDVDCIKWRQRGGGVAEYDVLPNYPGFRARLLRIRAGGGVPHHTHEGREVTLVLDGSFSDECGHFERGDVEVAGSDVEHKPVAGPERDCICFAVTDAPLRMTGPFGRILNYFVDM